MVQYAGGDAGLLELAVAVDERRDPAHVDLIGLERSPADDDRRIGRVVGDGVDDLARALAFGIDTLHARVEDLKGRRDVVGGVEHVEDSALGALERALQHKGQLRLDADGDEAVGGDLGAVGVEHVVEQRAEIGLADADRVLHGL